MKGLVDGLASHLTSNQASLICPFYGFFRWCRGVVARLIRDECRMNSERLLLIANIFRCRYCLVCLSSVVGVGFLLEICSDCMI